MTNIRIFYGSRDYPNETLTRQSQFDGGRYVYNKCPVVNHKLNRTFIGTSPIDFSFLVDRKNKILHSDNNNLMYFDEEHLESTNPVVQLRFPEFVFWTDSPNVWFEFNDHPLTSYKNNIFCINGWFNLSNWIRNISLGVVVVNEKNPVIIKKGDPLFRITFHSNNLNDGIILEHVSDPDIIGQKLLTMNQNQSNITNLKKYLFSKMRIQKCPFKFLHK